MYTKHFILTWIKAYYVQCFPALGCLKSLLKTLRAAFRYIKMAKHPLLQSSARHWCVLIEISHEEHKYLTTDLEGSSPQACLPPAHTSLAERDLALDRRLCISNLGCCEVFQIPRNG